MGDCGAVLHKSALRLCPARLIPSRTYPFRGGLQGRFRGKKLSPTASERRARQDLPVPPAGRPTGRGASGPGGTGHAFPDGAPSGSEDCFHTFL